MLKISKDLYQKIKDHGAAESPKEACGILAGMTIDRISIVRPCSNVDEEPTTAYTIKSEELIQTIGEIDNSSELVLIGFYHTHPFSSPHPSAVDIERATWDGYVYAIYSSLYDRLTFWRWFEEKKKFTELDFLIE